MNEEEIEVLSSESETVFLSDSSELEVNTEASVLVVDDVLATSSDINYSQITCYLMFFLVVFILLTRLEK